MTLRSWPFFVSLPALAVLGMSSPANAVPVYYTFSGNVSRIAHCDTSGCGPYVTIDGLGVGSIVSYTFLVDFDQLGRQTLSYPPDPPTVSTYPDVIHATYAYHSIFATYVSGSVLQPRTTLDGDQANGVYERGTDYSNTSGGRQVWLWDEHVAWSAGLTRSDSLYVWGSCVGCNMWEIGSSYFGSNYRYRRVLSDFDDIESVLTLTDISAAPVPEPSTLVLVGAGLLSLCRRLRSHRK